ncbi:hypothetical protein MHTCC0001_23760 [Flavobacteriaceae bacterium MHTCC 0001]
MKFKLNITFLLITVIIIISKVALPLVLKNVNTCHNFSSSLAVMSCYCLLRGFIKAYPFYIGIPILILIFSSKAIKLAKVLKAFNSELNALPNQIINSSFELSEIISYTIGVAIILIVDFNLIFNE